MDVTVQTTIDRPVALVSAYTADLANAVHWMSAVSAARWEGEKLIAVGGKAVFATTIAKEAVDRVWEIAEYSPGERMVLRTKSEPFPAQLVWTWAAAGSGTTMGMSVHSATSLKDRVTAPLRSRELRQSITEDLGALKGMLEGRPVG